MVRPLTGTLLFFFVFVLCHCGLLHLQSRWQSLSHLHFNQLLSWTRVNIGLARVAGTFVRAALGFHPFTSHGLHSSTGLHKYPKNDASVRFGKLCYLFIRQFCQLTVSNFDFAGQFCFTVYDSLTAGNKIPLKNLYSGTICEGNKKCNHFFFFT